MNIIMVTHIYKAFANINTSINYKATTYALIGPCVVT